MMVTMTTIAIMIIIISDWKQIAEGSYYLKTEKQCSFHQGHYSKLDIFQAVLIHIHQVCGCIL